MHPFVGCRALDTYRTNSLPSRPEAIPTGAAAAAAAAAVAAAGGARDGVASAGSLQMGVAASSSMWDVDEPADDRSGVRVVIAGTG